MKNKEALDTLHDIKELMEKSTKFMSISGISAILVGIYACIGTGLVYFILNKQDSFVTAAHTMSCPAGAYPAWPSALIVSFPPSGSAS